MSPSPALGTAPHDVRPFGQLAVYFCFYLFLLVAAMTPRDVSSKEGNVVQLPRARFTVRLTHAAEGFYPWVFRVSTRAMVLFTLVRYLTSECKVCKCMCKYAARDLV